MAFELTASLSPISPDTLSSDGYELSDQNVIPNENIVSSFIPFEDKVELWIYDSNNNLIGGNPDYQDYVLAQDSKENISDGNTSILTVDPINDAFDLGFDTGQVKTIYNFIRYALSSSNTQQYFISEISSDRTELRLASNFLSNSEIESTFTDFKSLLDSNDYFDEFYLNFEDNQYQIGVNLKLDKSNTQQYSILVKLYDSLPLSFNLKDEASFVTKVAESVAFQIDYPSVTIVDSDITYLQGPNINLDIKDFVNNSTELKSKSELISTNSSESKDNLLNVLNRKGVQLTPNYSYDTFNEFVNFSSAKTRIENFIEKVEQIQAYESDITTLQTITGSTSESVQVSSSIASAYTNIENLIKNFDGYEYYLYYDTGSQSTYSYPKTGSYFPWTLKSTTSTDVLEWLGSDDESSQYYGGILLSASLYDENNQNWLYYTIPDFIKENEDNNQYILFSNMVGQHFDEIWMYTKAVAEKSNTTSKLEEGIPLKLAEQAIASLGYKGLSNNFNNEGNYIGLTGEDNNVYVPPTGSEIINNYIAVNGGGIVNYWALDYSYENYVEQLLDLGWPYPIDKVSKEIFKRLYHNMAYLTKKKGTIAGLRQLINIWGIPDTILKISEFGGKNQDNSDDYDLWYNRYSYAYSPISTQNLASSSVTFPWMPLHRNYLADNEYIVPDSIQFRFKTTGLPSSSYVGEFYTQSLLVKKSDGDDTSTEFDFGVALYYDPPSTGSYSGSFASVSQSYGTLKFYLSGSAADGGVSVSNGVYLPFFDGDWWSVMLQRDTHVSSSNNTESTTYTLFAKNKIYNGWDGNEIGYEGSASITNTSESINDAWNKFGTGSADGIYLGGFVSGSQVGGITLNNSGKIFSGSLQEFRYYAYELSESIFNDFVMNPESIEGINITGSLSSFDILNFRAPLGNELEHIFTSSLSSSYTESLSSLHPSVSTSANLYVTESFINPVSGVTSSNYDIIYYENSTTRTFSKLNTEVYFLDQPSMGIRNRISNKIQVQDNQEYGSVLSQFKSIEQDAQISRSYTEDINSLEVAFSPQDEINDDIIQTLGFGSISQLIADPRNVSESLDYYNDLRRVSEEYFKKYSEGNIYDYIRLIKYFDNSIFKAIKNYVPARTNVSTGIVIKQHLLERNRKRPTIVSLDTTNLDLTSSISVSSITGSTWGSVNQFNYSGSPDFHQTPITQSWNNTIQTTLGPVVKTEDTQKEFYDGEYSGSELTVTTQSLLHNPFLPSGSEDTGKINYSSSDYNPLINSVNENRDNTFLMKIEYGDGITTPSNLDNIKNLTAEKAETPDSNYSIKANTLSKYLGSKVKSADYNFYTPSSSSIKFVHGGTGSWDGDDSYGKTAAIDKNPIYFAHFKSSKENYELWDTYTFRIDSLIEVPFEDIKGTEFEPKPLKLEGSNDKLLDVSSTFEKNRKAIISYARGNYNNVDYTSLQIGDNLIFQGGLEYNNILSTEKTNTNLNSIPSTSSGSIYFNSSSWGEILTGSVPSTSPSNIVGNDDKWLITGSGAFILSGSEISVAIPDMVNPSPSLGSVKVLCSGSALGVIHTLNRALKTNFTMSVGGGIPKDGETGSMGIPPDSFYDVEDPRNHHRFNPIGSYLIEYENFNESFLIERGDEIRVTYDVGSTIGIENYKTVDFIVKNVTTSSFGTVYNPGYKLYFQNGTSLMYVNTSSIFDRIEVNPDPSTLSSPIREGKVTNFTIRRRVNADDRVILYQTAPSGSAGFDTISGEGYIIPNDMTITQKRNVQTIINQLKDKNAFRDDDINQG